MAMTTVQAADRTRIPAAALADFYTRAFSAADVPAGDAATVAHVLLTADVLGIDSHGAPLVPDYINRLRSGLINPQPHIRAVSEYPGTLVLDGDHGLGPVVGTYAMRQAIAKARVNGVATVSVRNSNHYAACCNYPLLAVEEGMAGMTMTSAGPGVVPTFGVAPLLGTNPISIAFPGGNQARPFLLDMATSVVAKGKVGVYRREGKPLPTGWAYDADMQPTTDPAVARYLNTLGGDRDHSSQKGYGLSMAVDLFTALLSGGRYSARMYTDSDRDGDQRPTSSQMFTAWRLDAFVAPEEYAARFDEYIAMFHDSPPAPGAARVLTPGDPEWAAEADRRTHGVPLHPIIRANLETVARDLDIPFVA
jgi:L-2-hydroxycarboxylate dehydrogenase (NAD+)